MPKVYDPTHDFLKVEVWGPSNSGKTLFLYSIFKLPPPKWGSGKNKIIVFTNEAHYAKTIKIIPPEGQSRFEIYQHRTLEEFDADVSKVMMDYNVYASDGQTLTGEYDKIRDGVHAILVDEIHCIYQWVCMHRTHELKIDSLRQSQYGVTKDRFARRLKFLFSMPCHVLMACKTKPEYEEYRATKVSGEPGALSFRKTGKQDYPLFEEFEYNSDTRIHLFRIAEMTDVDDPNNPGQKVEAVNRLGEEVFVYPQFGEVLKNKAKGDERFTLESPTVRKVALKLRSLALQHKVEW